MIQEILIETVKLTPDGYLLNGTTFVPNAPGNRHYEAIQVWISEGNTPEPADAPSLVKAQAAALDQVNVWAAQERAKWRTPGMSETYAQKQRDVDAWARIVAAGGTPTAADLPYAARRAARKNGVQPDQIDKLTLEQLGTVIGEYTAAIAFLRVKDLDIEDRREGAKEAVAVAATVAEVEAALAGLKW
jgi:hypothetical protein